MVKGRRNTQIKRQHGDIKAGPQDAAANVTSMIPKWLMLTISCAMLADCQTFSRHRSASTMEMAIEFCSSQLSYGDGLSARLSSDWGLARSKSEQLSFSLAAERYYSGVLADQGFRDFLNSTGTSVEYFLDTILECQLQYLAEHSETILRVDRREVSNSWTIRNDHCQAPQAMDKKVSPSGEGWRIDPTTIAVTTSSSSKSTFEGVFDKSEVGYWVRGRIVNNGSCVTVDGVPLIRDGRGSLVPVRKLTSC